MFFRSFLLALLAMGTCLSGNPCRAGFTFLGPTPYLSAADSPFAKYLGGPNFYLEDFEDGELNTLGIGQPVHPVFGTAFQGVVMGPSELTDSVDADDGLIDGSGSAGHSFRSRALFYSQTIPQRNNVVIEFEFYEKQHGLLPDAFGFVWTDGPVGIDFFRPGLDLRITVTDFEGNRFLSPFVKLFPNQGRNGLTSEDVFIGVISDAPITKVTIGGVYYGESELMPYLEIDHVQYGLIAVPEPSSIAFCSAALLIGAAPRRRQVFLLVLLALGTCLSSDNTCQAGFTFLGPTPYLSAADSPFAQYLGGPNFYLEDFEDGELNTPGIFDDFGSLGQTIILGPSELTNSVDFDDGNVDGDGSKGHSFASTFITFFPTNPRINHRTFHFSFEAASLEEYPTAFGFVWTDGAPDSTVLVRIFNSTGEQIGETRFHGLGDVTNTGTTADDRFIGFFSTEPIGGVEIISIFWETMLDHLRSITFNMELLYVNLAHC